MQNLYSIFLKNRKIFYDFFNIFVGSNNEGQNPNESSYFQG